MSRSVKPDRLTDREKGGIVLELPSGFMRNVVGTIVKDARRLVKRSNSLVKAVHSVKGVVYDDWVRKAELRERLSAFAPNSAGRLSDRGVLAVQAAQQVFPLLSSLISMTSPLPVDPVPIADIFPRAAHDRSTAEIANLFNLYGSDKASEHDYHRLYGPMLGPRRKEPLQLLEIGLGTNNPEIVSTMGLTGRPGASLRAFRDFLPNAQIVGADIDRRVLFSEDRIETYFVDQTNKASFDDLARALASRRFDFVIDDGLHSPNANLATMLFSLLMLKKGGVFVAEDISADAIPIWQTVATILPDAFMPTIIQAKNGFLFKITTAS